MRAPAADAGDAGDAGDAAQVHDSKLSYAYRDFSVGCAWNNTTSTCDGASWEITEPDVAYQGAFVLLASFLLGAQ